MVEMIVGPLIFRAGAGTPWGNSPRILDFGADLGQGLTIQAFYRHSLILSSVNIWNVFLSKPSPSA